MSTTVINLRTDRNVKMAAQKVSDELGLSLSAVLNGFLREFIRVKTVKFSVAEEPSPWLVKQIRNAEENLRKGKASPTFGSADEAISWLKKKKIL